MAYTPTTWENLPSTNTPINATNLNNIETQLYQIIKNQTIQIPITTRANGFVYATGTFTIPTGYQVVAASIVGNGYLSEVIASIISLAGTNVVVNAFSNAVKNATVVVNVVFAKTNS